MSHGVNQIIEFLPPSQWRHAPTRENPANLASRGLLPLDLLHCSLLWDGPQWLQQPPSSWPSLVTHRPVAELLEARAHVTQAKELDSFPTLLCQSFISRHHLLRAVAWVRQFIQNSRLAKDKRVLDPLLTPTKIDENANLLLHLSQLESFPDVYFTLKEGKPVTGPRFLCSLNPLLGRDGLIRLVSRLQHADLPYNSKHPVLLHRKSRLTELLVRDLHLHSPLHPTLTPAESYFVVGARNLVKAISQHSIPHTCARLCK